MPWLEPRPGGYVLRWRENNARQCSEVITRKDVATARLREKRAELAARKPAKTGADLSIDEILARYEARQLSRGSRAIHVDKQVGRLTQLCEAQGWTTCRRVTPASIEAWRQSGGSPRAGAYLRAVLRWAKETLDQHVDDRALIALRPRPIKRRPRAMLATSDQLADWQAKADQLDPSVGALIHCLATYGWRPITAADLIVGNLDLSAGLITTTVKGGDIVRHPLLPATLARLRPLVAGRPPSAPLFVCPATEGPWEPNASHRHSIVQCCRSIGLKSYDLKRWAISSMLARKLEPQTVALFTGHRTISQVLTYARTNEDRAREALASLAPPPVGTSGQSVAVTRV